MQYWIGLGITEQGKCNIGQVWAYQNRGNVQYWICLGVIKEGECAILDRFRHNTTGGMCDI